jgi:hypothetical protein
LIYFIKDTDPILQSNDDDEERLSHIEHEQDEMPMPVVYKKRARVKFTQEQVEI